MSNVLYSEEILSSNVCFIFSTLYCFFVLCFFVVVSHDYEPQNSGELALRRNDVVIVREERGEWWRGVNARGQKGIYRTFSITSKI